MWKEISGLQTTRSYSGLGNKDGYAVTAIHLYQPDTEEWVKMELHDTAALVR
jgi:hypothetical protein